MSFVSGFEHIVRDSEPLAPYTWFRMGGVAEYFAEPTSEAELSELVRRCRAEDVTIRLLGGGSNLLVRPAGVRGMVIHLATPAFGHISVTRQTATAGGGAKLGHLISTAVREGLAGLEPLVGIPGTVGAAVRGNADGGGGDIGQWIKCATVMTRSGEIVDRDDLRFSYRQSSLDELVILRAEFELESGDSQELTKRMQKAWIAKKASQPPGNQNLGYIFKDVGGVSAANLIEQAGFRGAHVGNAIVGERDANYIVAQPGASSDDVLGLIELLRNGVSERLSVDLETQIEVW